MPPLYKVKLGSQEFYFEKDAQLEDLLARERIPNVDVTSRDGDPVKLTEAKWSRFAKDLQQYEGYFARLRSDFGAPATELMVLHRLVEHEIERPDGPVGARSAIGENGYVLSLLDGDEESSACGSSRPRRRPRGTSPCRRAARLADLRGLRNAYASSRADRAPPFTVTVGKETDVAETFDRCASACSTPRSRASRSRASRVSAR